MKASKLILQLKKLIAEFGDCNVQQDNGLIKSVNACFIESPLEENDHIFIVSERE